MRRETGRDPSRSIDFMSAHQAYFPGSASARVLGVSASAFILAVSPAVLRTAHRGTRRGA